MRPGLLYGLYQKVYLSQHFAFTVNPGYFA